MLGSMKRRRREKSKPCPCGGSCECHQKSKEHWLWYLVMGAIILFVVGMTLWDSPPPKRYVYVRGKQCEIHWVQTGITSTGAGIGHDEAICP
jgi:hypothetical protein